MLFSGASTSNIDAQFAAARTSGVGPLAVFFDATATTASGVTYPFHELDYAWDFGDTGAGNWTYGAENGTPGAGAESKFTGDISGTTLTVTDVPYGTVAKGLVISGTGITGSPTITAFGTGGGFEGTYTLSSSQGTLSSRDFTTTCFIPTTIWNADRNKAYGPVTAHLFKTPGTFTVNLTVKNASGSVTATPVTITVTDPDVYFGAVWSGSSFSTNGTNVGGTICISTSNNSTGVPSGARFVNLTSGSDDFATIIGTYLNGASVPIRVLLCRGDTFTAASHQTITKNGPGQLGAYGSGNLPKISLTADTSSPILTTGNNSTVSDWRITDLNIDPGAFAAADFDSGIQLQTSKTTINNVNLNGYSGAMVVGNADLTLVVDQSYVGNTTILHAAPEPNGSGASYFQPIQRFAFMGNDWEDSTHSGWMMRTQHHTKTVWSHNIIARGLFNKAVWEIHGNGSGEVSGSFTSGLMLVSDNTFVGDNAGGAAVIHVKPQVDSTYDPIADVIFERNRLISNGNIINDGLEFVGSRMTSRLNIFQNGNPVPIAGSTMFWQTLNNEPSPNTNNIWQYYNTLYDPNSSALRFTTDFFAGVDILGISRNNLVYMPNATNAIVQDMSSPSWVADHNSSNAQAGGTNPLFTNGSTNFSLPTDFALQSGSYAKAAGTALPPVFYDFNRNPIPTSNPNMGAIQ